uniref:Uncharacterized protein n=1 Tax=Opuntia streptacantha TaxID=393608 RepID=A0A7C8ZBJ4_OPUST
MNKISARGDARRNLTNSTSISTLPSVTYVLGAILIFSRTGEFPSKNRMNSISCGTPFKSVIITVFSRLSVQSEGHRGFQKSKSDASIAGAVFGEPLVKYTCPLSLVRLGTPPRNLA